MPRTLTRVRVHNPGKRKLSLAQKLHFGSKRQRAAAKLALSSKHKKRRVVNGKRGKFAKTDRKAGHKVDSYFGLPRLKRSIGTAKGDYKDASSRRRGRLSKAPASTRVGNPGEIITLTGLGMANPGIKKGTNKMAKRRTKRAGVRRRTRRAHNPKVIVRYRTRNASHRRRRRANTGRLVSRRRVHRRHRRSNPGFLSGGVGMLIGIFGGAALTGAIASRIPGQLNSGIAGYLTTGVIAYAQGTIAGKVFKNPALGKNMITGGLIYLGLKIAGDFFPSLSLPFGLSGLGAIAPSAFNYPQLPPGNSMLYANQVAAAGTPAAVATMRGMGRIARLGRMN